MSDTASARRVLIAEDQTGMRGLVRQLVNDEQGLQVVGEATTGQEVLDLAQSAQPDVVVLDLGLPVLDGEVVLDQLKSSYPGVRVVVLSGQASAIIEQRLRQRGAAAVVEKGVPGWENGLLAEVKAS